jgi:hypothetical protein
MSPRVPGSFALLAVVALILAVPAPARQARQPDEPDLNEISMEVNALQALSGFNFTPEQLEKLKGLAQDAAAKPRKRDAAKVSKEYRDKLLELHAALKQDNDVDKIDQLSDELDELRQKENPNLDDGVDLSDTARKRAPQATRLLKLHQVTDYLAAIADELFDPVERLIDSLQSVRSLTGDAWKQRRQEITSDIVRLAAGIDAKKADKLSDQIDALLTRAHGMSKQEFKMKQANLEREARKLLGDVGPFDILRNEVEYALAELLSNPRLPAAVEARLKKHP